MADYEYYVNFYLGSLIPEKEFSALIKRAGAYLDKLCRTCLVQGGEDAKAMALCAMAEELYREGKHKGVASAALGSVSVHYQESPRKLLVQELYRQASIYLDIHKGGCPA